MTSYKRYIIFIAGSIFYFTWFYFFVGIRAEHLGIFVLCLILYFIHPSSKRFILGFSIFLFYWFIFDSMRVIPNYEINTIHILEPYQIEKNLFGINTINGIVTPNEYLNTQKTAFLDIMSGLFYLNWVPIPLLFAIILFKKRKLLFLKFSYAFLFTNLIGFICFYLYPSAPPWYVNLYGFKLCYHVQSNAAGLLNFDHILGIKLFKNMYLKNSNVFAAMPSLHSSYPVLCFLYAKQLQKWWLNIIFIAFTIGIWFSAVYSNHHYIIDVIAGGCLGVLGYYIFEYISEKTIIKKWIEKHKDLIK